MTFEEMLAILSAYVDSLTAECDEIEATRFLAAARCLVAACEILELFEDSHHEDSSQPPSKPPAKR
jgi:hypothetical protein